MKLAIDGENFDAQKVLPLKYAPLLGKIYRYMNFNEIAEFVEVAEKVTV